MNCERCKSFRGGEARFRIRTEIINLNVCQQCADDARALGLPLEPLPDATASTEKKVVAGCSA
jgi:hypothetical protein